MCPSYDPHAAAACLRAAELVESRINDRVPVAEMSDAAGYSLFSFIRLFSRTVGMSPYDYQMKRKLTTAHEELQSTDHRITDIALAYGFETPEGFSRAYRRFFGVLPSDCRRGVRIDQRRNQPVLNEDAMRWVSFVRERPPEIRHLENVVLHGTAHTAFDIGDSLNLLVSLEPDRENLAVVYYSESWERHGPQVFVGSANGSGPLQTTVAATAATTFELDLPLHRINSFLEWFWLACGDLPNRLIIPITGDIAGSVSIDQ